MADIFLSYSREDRDRVRPIVDLLKSVGWSVWWDTNMTPGGDFDAETEQFIKNAKCVVVAWSKESIGSRWVRGEARVGADKNAIVPVLIDEVEPPIDFRAIQCIDLTGGAFTEQQAKALTDAVGKVTGAPANAVSFDQWVRRSRWLRRLRRRDVAVTVGAAALSGIIGANWTRIGEGIATMAVAPSAMSSDDLFSGQLRTDVEAREVVLENRIAGELNTWLQQGNADPWFMAQATSALPASAVDHAQMLAYFDKSFIRACTCWTPIDGGQHAVANAWIVIANAALGNPVRVDFMRRILSRQRFHGSWPIYFNAEPKDQNESVYATAFITLALHLYSKAALSQTPQTAVLEKPINEAIEHATRWLYLQAPKSGDLWTDYPRSDDPIFPSAGVSAMAVYVLQTIGPTDERRKAVLTDWMKTLKPPEPLENLEAADEFIGVDTGEIKRDSTRYIVLPWQIAAMSACYPSMTTSQRVLARRFTERAMKVWRQSENVRQSFVAAEALFALRSALAVRA